ncbi:hypothetical protein QBC40DRAFT_162861 [Triangularia verruculosa]|uniref:RBR-type E3 ubiquitin transferase n=1 Tax=Triangularia verruculosa TaxID=2587418 RepID=A0AAN7AXQ3_9PEZI|nr:hypothetical protein QBC40DRAFT_162861 [Triangularia verruculosa]
MHHDHHEPHFELRGGRSRSHSSPVGAAGFLSRFFRPHQTQPPQAHHRSHRHHQDDGLSSHHHHTKEKEINPSPDNDHVHDIPPKPTKTAASTKKRNNPWFQLRPPKPKQKKTSSNVGSSTNHKKRSPGSRVSSVSSAKPKKKTRLTLDIKPLLDSNPSFPKISFQYRSSGLSSSRVEKFVREELKAQRISLAQDGFVRLYDASGKRFESGDYLSGTRSSKPITIWYRLSSTSDDTSNKWAFSSTIKGDERDKLNKMIEEGATVGEIRKEIAGYLEVKEPRRIRLYADDGIFHGFLLGEGWVLREIGKKWLTRYLAVHIRSSRDGWVEARLKGWGNDAAGRRYIMHPASGENHRWTIRDLKINLVTTGLVNIQQQQRKRSSKLSRKSLLSSGGIKIRFDGKRVSDSEPILWTQTYDFDFSSLDDAELFAADENWLLKPTETCDICVEDRPVTSFPITITTTTRSCRAHKPPLCKPCLAKWLAESIQSSGSWRRLTCPDPSCPALLGHSDVKRYASAEVFLRYDRWLLRDALQEIKGFVACVTIGCDYGVVMPDPEICPVFNCRKCKGSHCVRHNVAHPGESCKEYRRRQKEKKEQEEASEREVRGMTRDCPRCGRRGTGLLLCRHNEGCTEGPLPGAELFNDDGTLRDPGGQEVRDRPVFRRVNIPDMPGAEWLFPGLRGRDRQPAAAATPGAGDVVREELPLRPPGPGPEGRGGEPPMMTGANPGLVRPNPPPWAPGGVRPRIDGGRRARFLGNRDHD